MIYKECTKTKCETCGAKLYADHRDDLCALCHYWKYGI